MKGWEELVKDNDTSAIKLFGEALHVAEKANNEKQIATTLLNLGIASYGASLNNGLSFALQALEAYKKTAANNIDFAEVGRGKCLQLISTIKAREGKYKESIALSKEAMGIFMNKKDTSSSLGLVYNSLGQVYDKVNMPDSSEIFHRKALLERLRRNDMVYLPVSYSTVADIELKKNNYQNSKKYYEKSISISEKTGNKQSFVMGLIGLSKWYFKVEHNISTTNNLLQNAKKIANMLSDKSYFIQVLSQQKNIEKETGNIAKALQLEEEIIDYKEQLSNLEKERITKSLEVQFDVAEKDRQLEIIQKEKAIYTLTNYILIGALCFIIVIALLVFTFLRRINKRNKQVLQAKEELVKITEQQKILKEQQLQNEIEFKESQLSALTLQMLQKIELLQELKEKLEETSNNSVDTTVSKIINKGISQDKEWDAFNSHFESINKNFYSKIKQAFPEISLNELKICALIKMNLSIKEMASILNISPDSVKTARYRLRKKLQLNTEDNLTEFILNLK
jgi:DNA-binding CsgD family transcriptional regulator